MLQRVQEIPFDSERKRMTTIHQMQTAGRDFCPSFTCPTVAAFVKGAPDMILDLCANIIEGRQSRAPDRERRQEVLGITSDWPGRLCASWAWPTAPGTGAGGMHPARRGKEPDLRGPLGMIDPARPEVKEAVKIAQGAGLKSVMVTGDYKDTAQAIAKEIGLLTPGGRS